jgi:hypothetical protein
MLEFLHDYSVDLHSEGAQFHLGEGNRLPELIVVFLSAKKTPGYYLD